MLQFETPSEGRLVIIVEDLAATRGFLSSVVGTAFPDAAIQSFATLGGVNAWLKAHAKDGRVIADGKSIFIVLVDLGLPDGSGIDLIRDLATHHSSVVPVVTTIYDDDDHVFEAISAGAQGYLLKDQETDQLVHLLTRLEAGEPPLAPAIARRMLDHFRQLHAASRLSQDNPAALTPREQEVLGLAGAGLTLAGAAREMGVSRSTVASHLKAVYAKLNISTRAQAALEAARRGLV